MAVNEGIEGQSIIPAAGEVNHIDLRTEIMDIRGPTCKCGLTLPYLEVNITLNTPFLSKFAGPRPVWAPSEVTVAVCIKTAADLFTDVSQPPLLILTGAENVGLLSVLWIWVGAPYRMPMKRVRNVLLPRPPPPVGCKLLCQNMRMFEAYITAVFEMVKRTSHS